LIIEDALGMPAVPRFATREISFVREETFRPDANQNLRHAAKSVAALGYSIC
jgi:hypothetical protein